jgi:transcriptional regulator with XRE-family HTH domain
MGRALPAKPKRIAEKLFQIRQSLELSQNQMLRRLGSPDRLLQTSISGYERGIRDPPLLVLLAYSEVAGVHLEVLVDDALDLPARLPCRQKHPGIRRKNSRSKGMT